MNRFDYIKYDKQSCAEQAEFKMLFTELEESINTLPDGRAKSQVLTKIEEAYMWIGKAIRDKQLFQRGGALQEERSNE